MNRNVLLIALIGSVIFLNLLGLRWFARADVTRDGAFTLAQATKETMASLEEPVTITAYFTENLPPPYSSNARYVRDLLEEFRAASKGKLAFEFVDPQRQETDEDKETKKEFKRDIFGRRFREPTTIEKELSSSGIQPVEIRVVEEDQQQTKRAYMALVIKHQEKKEVIPLIQSTASVEYDITSLIRKMTRQKTPVIGILQGHEEPKLDEKFRFLQTMLSQTYSVQPVTLGQKDRFDSTLDALFIVGPKTALSPTEMKAVDQFLMEGKSVAFFLDTVHVDLRTFEPTMASHGLEALLKTYGVTVGNQLVADAQSGTISVSERRGYMVVGMPVPFPFAPIVKRLEGESPISNGLGDVAFPFSTQVEASGTEGVQATVLARSSAKSWLETNSPPNIDPRRDWRAETITPSGPYSLMVQLSGTLKSHYASEASQSGTGAPLLAQSKGESRVIVVGSSALIQDDFMNNQGNQALLMNIADWLVLDPALLAMRNRGISMATLKNELPESTRNLVKFGNALGLPLALALFGLIRWRLRESARASVTI